MNAAKKLGTPIQGSTIRVVVSLMEDENEGYVHAIELHAQIPDVDRDQARRMMEAAHQTCPYSKALRGEASVTLIVD